MAISPGHFSQQASRNYGALNSEDREKLVAEQPMQHLSKKEVIRQGAKIFKKIGALVRIWVVRCRVILLKDEPIQSAIAFSLF